MSSTPTADQLDDIIFYARSGEIDDLIALSVPSHFLAAAADDGNTALHMASANGHIAVGEYIIATLGADPSLLNSAINAKNKEGNTSLHWASLNGNLNIVELLVKSGANTNIRNNTGHTPIYDAQMNGHEAVAEFLMRNMAEEAEDSELPPEEDEEMNDDRNATQEEGINGV